MKSTLNEIEINGVIYTKKEDDRDYDCEYSMVRTYSAGVFFGIVESREGKEVVLRKARRVWRWSGAAELCDLATNGTSNPDECKFPCEVDKVILTEVIEIIPITKKAIESLKSVDIWSE